MDYKYTSLYYSGLLQVKYYKSTDKKYHGALCYQDKLVDGDSGEELLIDDIIHQAEKDGVHFDDAVIELSWNPLDKAILE